MTHDYSLAHGTHATPEEGRCAMEWVSHLAGEPHSDAPTCVSPVLRSLCVALNDGLADGPRQRLRPSLARTIGTAGDGLDGARAWMAMDWLVRTYTPAWLGLASLPVAADALARSRPLAGARDLHASLTALERDRRTIRDTRTDAFCSRGNPVSGRAYAVRGARAGREAAWGCAGEAAWAAARTALTDDAGDRARALIRTIAGDAAAIAVHRIDADDVCGAPIGRAARRAALGPTLQDLADSAVALLERMLPTETVALPVETAGAAARSSEPPVAPAVAAPVPAAIR